MPYEILGPETTASSGRFEILPPEQKSFNQLMLDRETNDVSSGVRRGVKDALDTGAQGLAWLYGKVTGDQGEFDRVKAINEAGKAEYAARPTTAGNAIGRIGGNLLATTPATSFVGSGVAAIPGFQALGNSILSAGTNTGAKLPTLLDAAVRGTGGAVNGYISGGLVDPNQANTAAVLGGVLPPAVMAVGGGSRWLGDKLNDSARSLMSSALKPTLAQKESGEAATAVQTLLDRGINPTSGGVAKLQQLVNDTDKQISAAIQNSPATIDKQAVLSRLGGARSRFAQQVAPQADLGAIQAVEDSFLAHPNFPGQTIPVQDAQALKQGTYRVLSGKFGEQGSATTEAQKALARGLKEEIATAVPGISALNAEQSKLLATLNVTERRALMDLNKNPMGLSLLAQNPVTWAAFMADKSALFKSLAARMVNSTGNAIPTGAMGLLSGPAASPLVRGGLLAVEQPN